MDRVQGKCKKEKKCDGMSRNREDKKVKAETKDKKKANEEAPTGYVHVRARRGQATDSHSLAERVIYHCLSYSFPMNGHSLKQISSSFRKEERKLVTE